MGTAIKQAYCARLG